jgi:REP element-mobilizing transposase RayT
MPRTARLDIAGVLQHVIVRGVEKRDIFLDDYDRQAFLDRFCVLLAKMNTECLAWSLMRNHVHMLLRPMAGNLGQFMRRLLTGYAVTFNLRHHRSGHLFQNRYKSIICEEDPYLLELVRYIHLNPLRVGVVKDISALKTYPWSGHSVLMGSRTLPGQEIDEVLGYFGKRKSTARNNYQSFVGDGVLQGQREDLRGGGLRRVQKNSGNQQLTTYDDRILGSGEFVEQLRQEKELLEKLAGRMPLVALIEHVAKISGAELQKLHERGRKTAVVDAKGIICYLGVRRLGYSGEEVAKALSITRSGVSRGASRGGEAFAREPEKWEPLERLINKSTTSP